MGIDVYCYLEIMMLMKIEGILRQDYIMGDRQQLLGNMIINCYGISTTFKASKQGPDLKTFKKITRKTFKNLEKIILCGNNLSFDGDRNS